MKKIVFVIPDMPGGGTEKVVMLLANEYAKRNIPVAILLFAGSQLMYEIDRRVEFISISKASIGKMWIKIKRIWKMRSYFKRNKDCIIFSFSTMGTAFCVVATFMMKRFILVSERNDPNNCPNARWRDWAYKKADKLTFQTKDIMMFFPRSIQKKSIIIPNPIDDSIPMKTGNPREKTIVSFGRLEAQKNIHLLLEAYRLFKTDVEGYTLHIYGSGSMEDELKENAIELGINDYVVWHGFVSDVQEKIIDSGMYVLSSDYEGISNSMLEALAMGIPTVATDCLGGGNRAYIEDGMNGLLIPTQDAKAMAQAMKRIALDDDLANRLSENAIKVRETHSVTEIADMFLECVKG